MRFARLALWVLGSVGSGKSTLLTRLPEGFQRLDQDAELERAMSARNLPWDTRVHSPEQAAHFAALRREIADLVWFNVNGWRLQGVPIAFEVTGDKPSLLRIEVAADRAAGYQSLGVGVNCPLEDCLRRNRARRRVLPDSVVESTWHAFQTHLAKGVYSQIFGPSRFQVARDADHCDLAAWLESYC